MAILRYTVFALVAFSALAALAVMAVQRRQINPFGRAARTIRRMTDPFLKPIERRVLRSGGNPQYAPWWMLVIAVLGGILTISAVEWVVGETQLLVAATHGGARPLLRVVVDWTLALINIALIVRVVGSWLGADRFTPWMKPFYFLTEWFLAPLRRVLPTLGPLDISPLVAWLVLDLVVRPLMRSLI